MRRGRSGPTGEEGGRTGQGAQRGRGGAGEEGGRGGEAVALWQPEAI